jgi:hypothetical protein
VKRDHGGASGAWKGTSLGGEDALCCQLSRGSCALDRRHRRVVGAAGGGARGKKGSRRSEGCMEGNQQLLLAFRQSGEI